MDLGADHNNFKLNYYDIQDYLAASLSFYCKVVVVAVEVEQASVPLFFHHNMVAM